MLWLGITGRQLRARLRFPGLPQTVQGAGAAAGTEAASPLSRNSVSQIHFQKSGIIYKLWFVRWGMAFLTVQREGARISADFQQILGLF